MSEPIKLKSCISIVPSPESCVTAVNFPVGLGLSNRLTNVQSHPSYKSSQPLVYILAQFTVVLVTGCPKEHEASLTMFRALQVLLIPTSTVNDVITY